MKTNHLLVVALAALVVVGTWIGTAQGETKPATQSSDPRIDKLLEQNEQILKNQAEIKKQLEGLKQDILQIRRRSS
jgi:hypothetical protein